MVNHSDILHGKILITDDQAANVLLVERMLCGAGYVNITSTMNPQKVCDLKNRYDLILLDLDARQEWIRGDGSPEGH